MSRLPAIETYYELSWRWMILLCAALIVYCGAGRPVVTMPPMLFAFLLVTPWSAQLQRISKILVILCSGWAAVWGLANIGQIVDANDLASTMIEVVTSTLPIALIYRTRPTSYWLALLSTTLIAIGCLLFKGDIIAYSILLLYLGCITFALNSAHLFFLSRFAHEAKEKLPSRFFHQFLAVIPIGIIAGAITFFAFPRVKDLGASFGLRSDRNSSGYRGDISLNGGREISQNLALVFSIEMDDKDWLLRNETTLFLRGDTLSLFDGLNWRSEFLGRWPFKPGEHRINADHSEQVYRARIYREPNTHLPIFYPESLLFVQNTSKSINSLVHNGQGSLFRQNADYRRFTYDVGFVTRLDPKRYSQTLATAANEIKAGLTTDPHPYQLNDEQMSIYLRLPEEIGDDSFFTRWADSVNVDRENATTAAAIDTLTKYFSENFEASLINEFSAADSFRAFLTNDRRGHCEYFATATALFFRYLGIPSRVVVGYRGGIYNPVSEILEVREQNAHAWVEVFAPKAGWLTVDTTPFAPLTGYNSFTSNIRMYLSAFQFWFGRYIINYNQDTQRDLFRSVRNLKDLRKSKVDWTSVKPILMKAIGFSLILIAAYLLWRRRVAKKLYPGFPRYYRLLLTKLAAAGWPREKGESIRRYHQRLIQNDIDAQTLTQIANLVERDLYSADDVTTSERQSAENGVSHLTVPAAKMKMGTVR